MELIVILLAAMSGALIGSSTGIFLMYRKLRPVNAAELDALRSKVRTTEFDLNTAIANGVKLKREFAEQASKVSEEVVEKQKQLDEAVAARDLEAAHRSAAEHRIAELIAEADAGKTRYEEMEAKAKELEAKTADPEAGGIEGASPVSEEQQRQLAEYQAQAEAGVRQIQELTEQVTRLALETADLKQRSDDALKARTAVEAELQQRSGEAEKARVALETELQQRSDEAEKARVALEAELRQRSDEALKARAALEADLAGERERLHVLTGQVSELQNELSVRDVRMQEERVRMREERESAAKGIELLMMAQQNLSRVIQAAAPDALGTNGNGHGTAAPEVSATNGNKGHGELVPAVVTQLQTVGK
jgi:hypothetical protein